MNRREFLKQVAAFSAGAAAIPVFSLGAPAPMIRPAGSSTLVVATGKDYPALVAAAVAKIGGMQQFVKPGQKVVVKPNIGWDRSVAQAANTHPDVVKALVKLCLDQGAKEVKVFDRSCNDARRSYVNSGIQAAVESLKDPRATCPFVDDRDYMPVKLEHGKAMTEWEINRNAVECDCYINVPVAKHHGLTKLTLAMKNIMGVCGGKRGQIHQDIAQKLADLNLLIRPKLTVIDCTRILLAHGPAGGNLADVKVLDKIIVSADPVAAEAYAATLFGYKPEDLKTTVAANKAGLGEIDLSKVNVVEV